MNDKKRDGVALAISAPAATVSLVVTNIFPGFIGSAAFALGKIWQIGLPAFWRTKVEEKEISWSKPENGGFVMAAATGVGMSLVMFLAWVALGDSLDRSAIIEFVEPYGVMNPLVFGLLFCYWVLINSVMEEYVYRWFIFEKLETFVSGNVAIALSALVFTAHHFVAVLLMFPLSLAILASIGVFVGGAIWSWLYLKYRSIWPCYLSHAIVDVAMFGIGGYILFG